MPSKLSKKYALVNAIGVMFYMVSAISLMWACLPFLPKLLQLAAWLQPASAPTPATVAAPAVGPPSMMTIVIAVIVTVVMIGATIYILIKLPATVGKAGHTLTKQASQYVLPVVTHHAPLSPARRKLLTAKIIVYLKLGLCLLPVALAACSSFYTSSLPYSLILFIAALLSSTALALFMLQLAVARFLHVTLEHIW